MLRLFVCIWIPEEIRDRIVRFQKDMTNLPIKAKFVEPENIHLTVTFLGNVDERDAELIKKRLDDSVKNVNKFHVKLEGLKIIPSESYIRVLGINVSGGTNIKDLIETVGKSIDGSYHETTKLTLCRVKNVVNKSALRDFIETNRNIKIGEFQVDNVALVKSVLTKRGPIYETIHRSFLK